MDAEVYPQEVLAEEEPKYLRRQKPLEIKRRKFGKKAWKAYARVAMWSSAGLVAAFLAYSSWHFLYSAPEMALIHPDQVAIMGMDGAALHYVRAPRVLEVFAADRGKSVLSIPLDARRRQLESIPWIEAATVRRALPNQVQVVVKERTPIAFLRQGSDMALIDIHGVILDRPVEGDFDFPVITGIQAGMAPDDREQRMQLFSGFMQQAEAASPGAARQISEVDLSDVNDLRATITGLQGGEPAGASGDATALADAPLLVHFGNGDFQTKYANLVANIGKWRATAGRLESLDLRFKDEAVGNPDTTVAPRPNPATQPAKKSSAKGANRHSR
ncbi:MAG TPA: FtsQ-type POTRA domain-containing protein [Candidatus Acidoferrales bacterium]|nr:FtsQ-type POTRA domain-containing protein [Candidatus Acidoferrales bacterium]